VGRLTYIGRRPMFGKTCHVWLYITYKRIAINLESLLYDHVYMRSIIVILFI
jgi:hypothetical protein